MLRTLPTTFPSNWTIRWLGGGGTGTAGPVDADADMPRPVSTVMMAASVSSGDCDS